MRIDGFWAADEDTIEGEPGERRSDPPKPAKKGQDWDAEQEKKEPEESARDTYDDMPCTD